MYYKILAPNIRQLGALKTAFLVTITVIMSACSSESSNPTQVVAKVNNHEISVHQLNFFAQRIPAGLPQERIADARKNILTGLIEQETLVQNAVEQKIDRDPLIQQQLDASRRDILSRAYVDRIAGQAGKPTAEEINEFFAKNPDLFSQRKIFKFNEVVLPGVVPGWSDLEKALRTKSTLTEAVALLKSRGIDLPIAQGVIRATEALPLETLSSMATRKVGELVIFPQPPRIVIAQIVEVRSAPVDQEKAGAVIEQFLVNRKRQELVASETKRLREAVKVVYLGEFAQGAGTAAPQAKDATPTAPAATASATSAASDDSMQKGLKGLK